MSVTRIFRRRAGLERHSKNDNTAVIENPLLQPEVKGAPFDPREQFIERYSIVKKALECHRKQGVLILAFDQETSAIGEAWVQASLDRTRSITVGRHSMCNLVLPESFREVSLRHLLFLVRAVSHTDVRVRVLDLHTPTAFFDESGRVLQGVTTEGPMFLQVGPVMLMVLVTDEQSPILDDAEEAYRCIPERVFLEEKPGTAGASPQRPKKERIAPGATMVRSTMGPLAAVGQLRKSDELPRGRLVVRSSGGSLQREVGASILERGILIGRYSRCDVGASDEENSRLSRVHLLLLQEGEELVAIDTASTNGTMVGDKAILLEPLQEGVQLDLAGELHITWHEA